MESDPTAESASSTMESNTSMARGINRRGNEDQSREQRTRHIRTEESHT